MTIDEASKQYEIPIEVLKEYQSWGLCSAVKSVMGAWQYDDRDIERLSLIMTLHDIGFTNEEVEQYMRLVVAENTTGQEAEIFLWTSTDGKSEEQMQMLTRLRRKAMDEIHFKQKQLDRLDYLRYEIEKNTKHKR